MKKAFTLIELLVVIAIIAILAAILFPVFAQAKAAAKRSASLSNVKQTVTASMIYMSDYDDMLPVMTNWSNEGAYVAFSGVGCVPWTQIIQPYMKSYELLMDPQAPAGAAAPAGFNSAVAKLFAPQYGYNSYLANVINNGTSFSHSPKTHTAITRPAETVLFGQKYSSSETISNSFFGGYWFGPGSYFIQLSIDAPDCGSNTRVCAEGWNDNSYYGGTGGLKYLRNVEAAGAWTGGASLRGSKMMIVAWADGHASAKAPGALAQGTNYSGAKDAAGVPTQPSSNIVLTDQTKDMWYGEF